jgi:hypothetical protein
VPALRQCARSREGDQTLLLGTLSGAGTPPPAATAGLLASAPGPRATEQGRTQTSGSVTRRLLGRTDYPAGDATGDRALRNGSARLGTRRSLSGCSQWNGNCRASSPLAVGRKDRKGRKSIRKLLGGPALCLERGACVHWAPKNAASFLISRAVKFLHRTLGVVRFFAYAGCGSGEPRKPGAKMSQEAGRGIQRRAEHQRGRRSPQFDRCHEGAGGLILRHAKASQPLPASPDAEAQAEVEEPVTPKRPPPPIPRPQG